MSATTVKCPHCRKSFEMSAAVEASLRESISEEFNSEAERLRQEVADQKAALQTERTSIDREVQRRLAADRKAIEASARDAASVELAAAKEALEEQAVKVRQMQENEIALRKAQRALEAEKNEFTLEMTRKLDAERSKIVEDANRRVADEFALKEAEWIKQRADLVKQTEELRRKAEQGSQQLQGETLELEVESLQKETFPHDSVEPVEKGVKGADIVLTVQTRTGARCGSIIVELKRTKSFSEGWIEKVKGDMRAAKADVAVIATAAMPKGAERIAQIDGVWVVDYKSLLGVILALRAGLLEIAKARSAQAGRKDLANEVYTYVTSNDFKARIGALVESFVSMKDSLDAERRAMEKIWAAREKTIARATGAVAGVYGDLSGLGTEMPEIPQLVLEVQ
jgi:hypothetical protein